LKTKDRILRLVAAPLLAIGLVAVFATPANAATGSGVHPLGSCSPSDYYYHTTKTGSDNHDMVPETSGQPDTDLSITLTAGLTVTATFTGALQTEESAIIASAKETISASIALSLTASVAYGYHWLVPSNYGKTGYLHVGAQRDKMSWNWGHDTSTCGFTVLKTGTSTAPWDLPYSWHGSS
jgi:hypothetical protein